MSTASKILLGIFALVVIGLILGVEAIETAVADVFSSIGGIFTGATSPTTTIGVGGALAVAAGIFELPFVVVLGGIGLAGYGLYSYFDND